MLTEPEYEEAKQMTTTWFQEGKAEGKAEGLAEGKVVGTIETTRSVLMRLGTKRFGEPSAEVVAAIESEAELERLKELVDRVIDAKDWADLMRD